jgi:hypothetical protein
MVDMTGKYSEAVVLDRRERLTLISLNGNEFWVRNETLMPEPEPESKPKPEPKPKQTNARRLVSAVGRANISTSIKRFWRKRKGQNDVSEPRAYDM